MAWKAGIELMNEIITVLSEHIQDDNDRRAVYQDLIEIWEERNCDKLNECLRNDSSFDDAYMNMHPGYDDDEYVDEDDFGRIID